MGDSPPEEICAHYSTLVLDYIPIEYTDKAFDSVSTIPVVQYVDGTFEQYSNNIEIFENPETFSVRDNYIPNYCSDDATKKYMEDGRLMKDFKFSNKKKNVVKWNIPAESIVLVFGDVHGDIVSLDKTLNRWVSQEYLIATNEEPQYKMAANVYIISTGDLIDYGRNSMNVLCALLRLRADNPGKVMLLCGNHETPNNKISGRSDFTEEITRKKIDTITVDFVKDNIHLIGPDMLALHFGDELEGTYFMHGMYPAKDVLGKTGEYTTYFWPLKFEDMKPDELTNLIQWNDVSTNGETRRSDRKGLEHTHIQLGSSELVDIMNTYRIKGFIRGHQDLCGTHLYPLEFYENCRKTTSKNTVTMVDKKCSSIKDPPQTDGWCMRAIKFEFKFIEEYYDKKLLKSLLQKRVITTSIANEKTKGVSPMGGYIKITAVKIEPRRPPPSLKPPPPPPPSLKPQSNWRLW